MLSHGLNALLIVLVLPYFLARARGKLGFVATLTSYAIHAGYRKGIGRWVILVSIAFHPLAFLLLFRMRSPPKYDELREQEGRYVDWLLAARHSAPEPPSRRSWRAGSLGDFQTLHD